ncbi:MAG: hypothetical protein ACD_17C00248G0002 [uncultured bacterium]|nr:MAG: hypothetical protein ACD_17C00248G0002 [uncultured bacterium]
MGKKRGFGVDQVFDPVYVELESRGQDFGKRLNVFFTEKYFDLFAVWTRLPRYSWDFCNLGVVNGCIVRNAVYGEGDTKSIYNDPSICAN